jgi:transposase
MDLRKPERRAIFAVRDLVQRGLREYLHRHDFVEVQTPKLAGAGAEGGATLFRTDYFGKVAFLSQSPQLYKQMLMATGLDRVFELSPAFRAEPSDTVRHVTEFLSFDAEVAHIHHQDDFLTYLEGCVAHAIAYVREHGKAELRRQLRRARVLEFFANLEPCLIGMETGSGAHCWARELQKLGHTVRLMAPRFVKPYRKNDKSDRNDAEAICEAMTRPSMRFVPIKRIDQQDIQSLHRIRELVLKDRTALVNQIRGLLAEYGFVMPQGMASVRRQLPEILANQDNELTGMSRELFADLYQQFLVLNQRVSGYDRRIKQVFEAHSICQKIAAIEGVGPMTATAVVATVGDAKLFKNGRQMSAWLGLVPRQRSSGGKTVLLGISKRGDQHLRTLLIHGGRAVVQRVANKSDSKSQWLRRIKQERGANIAAVALANKNARVIWALMTSEEEYRVAV